MKKIKIVELFAGVGGFRLALEGVKDKNIKFETVWSSQWEPGTKNQYASNIYKKVFSEKNHSCEDIQVVIENSFDEISNHDLLVGGFPCQDYSVAKTLSQSSGIEGKKGVLWWSIYNILFKKGIKAPNYLMLENVDRLLKSPASQRGRDFAVMLASLNNLGYSVEWRVINAAEYGFPQRRRRVFILGYKNGTAIYKNIKNIKNKEDWINEKGVIADAFPLELADSMSLKTFSLDNDIIKVSNDFRNNFENAGLMFEGVVYTKKVSPKYKGKIKTLGDIIIQDEDKIPESFYIDEQKDLKKWEKLKGAKKEKRFSKSGHSYDYSEGSMVFPDALDKPSRTIVTGEGGSSPSRFKHVIRTKSGRLRRLLPIELERLNTFPSDHTRLTWDNKEVPDVKRAFIMGNALVVGVVKKLGESLAKFIK